METDFLEQVLAYVRDMAAMASPRSTRLIKQQLWDSGWELLKESFGTRDFAEGIASFREKRAPFHRGVSAA